MNTDNIQASLSDRVLTLRLARPEKKNALSQAMYSSLAEHFRRVNGDPGVRVVLLGGQPDCFSAGNDMKDFLSVPQDADAPTLAFMRAMAACEKPVVGAVSGLAIGVGVTLMLHCDIVICGSQTRLSLPFVPLGIRPEFASTLLLPGLMGHARTMELLLLGEFGADTARDYGLVNAVVPNADVDRVALEKARAIAELPPASARAAKAMLRRWDGQRMREAIDWEMAEVAKSLGMPEAAESIGAFLQKRKPDFSGFE